MRLFWLLYVMLYGGLSAIGMPDSDDQQRHDQGDGAADFHPYSSANCTAADVLEQCTAIENDMRDSRRHKNESEDGVRRHPCVAGKRQYRFHLIEVAAKAGDGQQNTGGGSGKDKKTTHVE